MRICNKAFSCFEDKVLFKYCTNIFRLLPQLYGYYFLSGYMFPDPKKSPLFGNGYHYPPHLASMPFMQLGHPMMSMAMANHMNMRPEAPIIPPTNHEAR